MDLAIVQPHFIDRAWRDGAHQLAHACDRANGEVTPDQLRMRLARGELILLALRDRETPVAWAAVVFEQHPNVRCLFVYAIYAPGQCFAESFDLLAGFARDGGASRIRGACDEAMTRLWERKFGFREAYRIMEKDL